jgi:hypothetical protein
MANIQPNRFVLRSNNGVLKVDYESTSFVGQPVLNLSEGSGPTRHFSGSQIRRLEFSVLIPAITLTGISDHKAFTTEAIVTTHTGPNSVPATGVHGTYQFFPMKGEANFVIAVLEPVLAASAKGGTA